MKHITLSYYFETWEASHQLLEELRVHWSEPELFVSSEEESEADQSSQHSH